MLLLLLLKLLHVADAASAPTTSATKGHLLDIGLSVKLPPTTYSLSTLTVLSPSSGSVLRWGTPWNGQGEEEENGLASSGSSKGHLVKKLR